MHRLSDRKNTYCHVPIRPDDVTASRSDWIHSSVRSHDPYIFRRKLLLLVVAVAVAEKANDVGELAVNCRH